MLPLVSTLSVALSLGSAPAHAATIVNRGGTLTYTGSSRPDAVTLRSRGETVHLSAAKPLHGRGCTTRRSGAAVCRRVKRVLVNARRH